MVSFSAKLEAGVSWHLFSGHGVNVTDVVVVNRTSFFKVMHYHMQIL